MENRTDINMSVQDCAMNRNIHECRSIENTLCSSVRTVKWEHWDQFPSLPYSVHICVGIILSVITILTMVGNGLTVLLLYRLVL